MRLNKFASFDIYALRRRGTISFVVLSVAVIVLFLYYSDSLVGDLSQQERERMQIWADATRELANLSGADNVRDSDVDFLLSIIERNVTIPVLLTDDEGNILMQRNFSLPDDSDADASFTISDANRAYLAKKLAKLRQGNNAIRIDLGEAGVQYLYYEDSRLLRTLSLYPYIQIVVLIVFVVIVYSAVSASRRAEQNKVWVGLSKETAHQLGTPISSLMAWMELLEAQGVDADTVKEMNKDVNRLSTIASRFSKIGSRPAMSAEDVNEIVKSAVDYMATRISRRITLTFHPSGTPETVDASPPLMQWVMENLIKNAVDAMDGEGAIDVKVSQEKDAVRIDVTDTGKGIPRQLQKRIFTPGFTTKKRGWGLGLTLTKRIVESYHNGHIFVSHSEPGQGTTFTILLPAKQ